MSPKLPRITAGELLRALKRDGWFETRQSGSHVILAHSEKNGIVVVPKHAGTTIGLGLLNKILQDASLTADDLRRLL